MRYLILIFTFVILIQSIGSSQPCLPDGIQFMTQQEVDDFQANYPGCTEIEGSVLIGDRGPTDISNLEGLISLNTIGGYVYIEGNSMTNFAGLENLTSIGGNLRISINSELMSLEGLQGLTSIGGNIEIIHNDSLISLTGLDNIDSATINGLLIASNPFLTDCAIQSICDYLVSPNSVVDINNNGLGCNSQDEIEDACETIGFKEWKPEIEISIYPNPANDKITITGYYGLKIETVCIYNLLGKRLLQINKIGENIDISTLGQGIYIIELISSELKVRQKLIIKE